MFRRLPSEPLRPFRRILIETDIFDDSFMVLGDNSKEEGGVILATEIDEAHALAVAKEYANANQLLEVDFLL